MLTIGLQIDPLDTLFFRGGRPFAESSRAESGLPGPQVFAGLIRTLLLERAGANFGAMRRQPSAAAAFRAAGVPWLAEVRCRGPWLARAGASGPVPVVPTPANIRMSAEGVPVLLQPTRRAIPGWMAPVPGMVPLWRGGQNFAKGTPAFLSLAGLAKYLRGEAPTKTDLLGLEDLLHWEERTGVGIDAASQASEDGKLYSTKSLRLKGGVSFYGEIEIPEAQAARVPKSITTAWGGERHHVTITRLAAPIVWPSGSGERELALLAAPAFPASGWLPENLRVTSLRGAAVRGPFAISGWDLANGGPKPVRFGPDAGSVYFVEGGPLPVGALTADLEDAACGYGFYLKGTWNYAE